MLPSVVISVSIDRPYADVADYLGHPHHFADWASGLENLQVCDGEWITQTPHGKMHVHFTSPNERGIADQIIVMPDGTKIYAPLRVIANQNGADVQFTLFRMPDMTDDVYARDQNWVRTDLLTLKHLLEKNHDTPANSHTH